MNDGSRTPKRPTTPDGSVNRREFLEQTARLSLAVGGASAIGRGLWLPDLDSLGETSLLQARGQQRAQTLTLSNAAIAMQWSVDAGRLHVVSLKEPNGLILALPDDAFTLILADGEPVRASEMRVVGTPRVDAAPVRSAASRLSARLPGRQVVVQLEDFAKRLRVEWRAELRDGSRYVRQEITVRPTAKDINIREVVLVDVPGASAMVNGTVKGSPLVIDRWYASVEHPLADSVVNGPRARSSLTRQLPLRM